MKLVLRLENKALGSRTRTNPKLPRKPRTNRESMPRADQKIKFAKTANKPKAFTCALPISLAIKGCLQCRYDMFCRIKQNRKCLEIAPFSVLAFTDR